MLCTVVDIRGDYAYVKYDETGVISEVAIALLPFGIDIGDRLKFEDYEFTQIYKAMDFIHRLSLSFRNIFPIFPSSVQLGRNLAFPQR